MKIPIWVADYVMMGYSLRRHHGRAAHDTRDLGLPEVQLAVRRRAASNRGEGCWYGLAVVE
jgi:hypothetical protein